MLGSRPPGEPTEQIPEVTAPPGGERRAPRDSRRLVASYPPPDLVQRIRRIPDATPRPRAANDATLIDRSSQPLVLEDLPEPIRQNVLDAVDGRSRSLAHLSLRQAILAGTSVLVLASAAGFLGTWVSVHAIDPGLSSSVTSHEVLLFTLVGLVGLAAATLAFCLARFQHHRSIRTAGPLVGPALGVAVIVVVLVALGGVLRPWSFPGPTARTVPLSRVTAAVATDHYQALTYGVVSSGAFSTRPAIFLSTLHGGWEVAPLAEPVPLLLSIELAHARAVPISAAGTTLGGRQTAALDQRVKGIGILLVVEVVLVGVAALLQWSRWRTPPRVAVSERQLRRLVDHIHAHGAAPVAWALGEDRLL